MIDFKNIEYLKHGNRKQKEVYQILVNNNVLSQLNDYTPILTGTIPINIDIETSDLDIACYWKEKQEFIYCLNKNFKSYQDFRLVETEKNGFETIIARFILEQYKFEIFGQNRPSSEQNSYIHMIVEYKILLEKGEAFRQEIIKLKKQGHKTEPAFGKMLNLQDPYKDLL